MVMAIGPLGVYERFRQPSSIKQVARPCLIGRSNDRREQYSFKFALYPQIGD